MTFNYGINFKIVCFKFVFTDCTGISVYIAFYLRKCVMSFKSVKISYDDLQRKMKNNELKFSF